MRFRTVKIFVTLLAALVLYPLTGSFAEDTVNLFAAASTTNALTEISQIYLTKHQTKIIPSFASSSTLAKQIQQGAPADVYVSANPKWMDFLEKNNMIQPGTRIDLLSNRIVLITPQASSLTLKVAPGFDLSGVLGSEKLAMGDPAHVPAGIYGKQALESLGVWKDVEAKVARAKDVRAALVLVEREEAPLGIVYATDAAISKKVKVIDLFPESSHPPIIYPAALVAERATPQAADFLKFLQSSDAKEIFEKYGFSVR